MRALEIIVSGRVQGVGFRHYTKKEADRLGVVGTIKNLMDGTVEINAEAKESILLIFLEWCHHGPSTSKVSKLEYRYIEIQSYGEFVIIR